MGIGGIGIWQLLIVLAIVVMIFGTKRLKSLGSDLGGAIKGFKDGIKESNDDTHKIEQQTPSPLSSEINEDSMQKPEESMQKPEESKQKQ